MVRPPHGGGNKYNKWTPEEDHILVSYVQENSPVNWASVPDNTGLKRRGASCRFRWINYLRPGIRRGNFTDEEDRKIIYLQSYLGNRWSSIAAFFPDRTHNDIKNYWNAYLKRKVGSAPGVNSAPSNTCRVLASYSVMTYRFSSFTYNVNWNRISAPGVAAPAPVSAIAVPVRPSAVAPPYAAPTPAFAVPVRPYAVAPPYAAPPTPAFAVPVRPSAFATPYAAAPTPAFAVPLRPSAVAPPYAAASTPAFAVLVRPSAIAPPYAAAPISAFAVPVCPSAAVPPYVAAPTPAFAVQGPVHPAFSAPTSVNTVPVHPSAVAPSAPSAAAPPHLV